MPLESHPCAIGDRPVGGRAPLFVIAEIGLNHGGSLDRALELVGAAADAGADAVKLQTIEASHLVSAACPAPEHVDAESMVDFFAQFELDERAHFTIIERARALGLRVLATPFSLPAVEMLDRRGIDAFKIASGDLTWDALIARTAATGRPLVISTGMATLEEIDHALEVARDAGAREIALLHCVSAYPVPRGGENLRAIRTLADHFGIPAGLSDHGDDGFAAPMAVALGASLYERHLVLENDTDAVDVEVSSTPHELGGIIAAARRAHLALGDGKKRCLESETMNRHVSRRSLCAARDLAPGDTIAESDLIALRPATGIPPTELQSLVGRQLTRAVDQGEPVRDRDLDASRVRSQRAS